MKLSSLQNLHYYNYCYCYYHFYIFIVTRTRTHSQTRTQSVDKVGEVLSHAELAVRFARLRALVCTLGTALVVGKSVLAVRSTPTFTYNKRKEEKVWQ